MRRTGTGIVSGAVAAACAAVALAGCAGTPAPFHPAGAAPRSGPRQTAALLARFPFPADVHFQFDTPLPARQDQAAATVADDDFQLAYYFGIYSQGKDHRYRSYIGDRMVLASVQETLAREAALHEGFTGTIRFYDTTVQPALLPGEQTVTSCVDSSRLLDTDIRTGQVRPDPGAQAGQSRYLESEILADRSGRWLVVGTSVTYYPQGQAKECTQ